MKKLCLYMLVSMSSFVHAMNVPDTIDIHLPFPNAQGQIVEKLNTEDKEAYGGYLYTFKEMIAEQAEKDESYILARVVDKSKVAVEEGGKIIYKEKGRILYYDAHALNHALFPVFPAIIGYINRYTLKNSGAARYPIIFQDISGLVEKRYGKIIRYLYLQWFEVPDRSKVGVDLNIGVQYFVFNPKKPQEGFQYLCSYTQDDGFHNKLQNSPYKNFPQNYFLNFFYANQNEVIDIPTPRVLSAEERSALSQEELEEVEAEKKEAARLKELAKELHKLKIDAKKFIADSKFKGTVSGEEKVQQAAEAKERRALSGPLPRSEYIAERTRLYNDAVAHAHKGQHLAARDAYQKLYDLASVGYIDTSGRAMKDSIFKGDAAAKLAEYYAGGFGLQIDYIKAKQYYTEILDDWFHAAAARKGLQDIAEAEAKAASAQAAPEEKRENALGAAQRQDLIASLFMAKGNFGRRDDSAQYFEAARQKFEAVYREAARDPRLEDLFQEAAYFLGMLAFKGGRSVPANNQKAIEYFDAIKNGPFLAQAQKYLLDIALAESMSQQARPQAPREQGVERKRDLATEAAERKHALEQSKEDLDYAAALVASLATVTSEEEDLARAIELSRAINVPAQQQYGQEIKRRAEEPVLAQGTNVGPELQLLAHELQALQTAVR